MARTRVATERLLQMVDDGVLDARVALLAALKYMSEDDVADMARANEFFTCSEGCGALVDADETVCTDCLGEDDDDEE